MYGRRCGTLGGVRPSSLSRSVNTKKPGILMGGSALKHLNSRRLEKKDYEALATHIQHELEPATQICHLIPSYHEKSDFVGMDILIVSLTDTGTLANFVRETFQPKELINNGDVLSFDYDGFQIDLISSPAEQFDISLFYYSFGDLNNLVGRIANRMGLKFGHRGLFLPVTFNTTHWQDIYLSTNPEQIYKFLGYSYPRFLEGFSNPTAIFQFVASSTYFSREVFYVESHKNRLRHRKRTIVQQFKLWLASLDPRTPEHQWDEDSTCYVSKALKFFNKEQEWHDCMAHIEKCRKVHEKFNGAIVERIAGEKGRSLGELMTRLKQSRGDHIELENWLLQATDPEIAAWIKATAEQKSRPFEWRQG